MPSLLRLTVHPFAQLRERLDETIALELPHGATAADLLARLVAEHPPLAPFRESLLLARGAEMLAPGAELSDGDVVMLYPPFSGG